MKALIPARSSLSERGSEVAKGLKSNGMKELKSLKARTLRQHALGRIGFRDKEFLLGHLNEIEARIIKMYEEGEETPWGS